MSNIDETRDSRVTGTRRDFMGLLGTLLPFIYLLPAGTPGGPNAKDAKRSRPVKTGVSYFGSRDPDHVHKDIRDIAAHNCSFIVHTYSEADYYFYSKIMKKIVAMSYDEGLDVYVDPWGVGGIFGGESFSRFVMNNPGDCQRRADGVPLPAACLNRDAFKSFMKLWIDSVAGLGAHVIFWDEPHFFIAKGAWSGTQKDTEWACACDVCGRLFREKFGRALPAVMDKDVVQFRDESIVAFFREMTDYAAGKSLKNAVCVLPQEDPQIGISSWEKLAAIKSLDIFGTDPYWMVFNQPLEYVRSSARRVMEIADKYQKEAQMWVQAYSIKEGREQEVGQAVRILAEEGVKNIAAWSYKGGAFMNLMSADYERVWEILGNAYGEIRRIRGKAGGPILR